jgi:cobyrinic acid a,c-diamide synthase
VVTVPRIVIAAPASRSGKTTVATGLMAALRARGLDVSPHKVGPDYIDPGYHALACGRPGRNLDPWLTSEELIAPLFLHGARGADVAVIEGVLGLFDGRGSFGSTAHVARLLGAPVVLVVDASSAGRSVAALVHGFATYEPGVWIGGVILNRIGSDRHEEICRAAVEETGLPVLGALRRHDDLGVPSRHLGLIPAAERHADATETVERLGVLLARSCDLGGLLALAQTAAPLAATPWEPTADGLRPGWVGRAEAVRVAVAGGPAFSFGYAENEELLAAAGADVVRFDPLRDEALPEGTRGIVIGGGFPEVYAAELSANEPLRARVAAFRGVVYAECAGLLYLLRTLDDVPMCGVLDGTARMTDRLSLGYREAVALADSPVARAGERFRGHEFHRTAVRRGRGAQAAWRWPEGGPDGYTTPNCLASYLHLHWAGMPKTATRFLGACA